MILKEQSTGHMVEILDLDDLFNLFREKVTGRYHYGEEIQDPEVFRKKDLVFLSGEPLPRCWTDPDYRQ